MAIAEMSSMTLVALSHEKDAILDALRKTGAVQIKESCTAEIEGLENAPPTSDGIDAEIERITKCLSFIEACDMEVAVGKPVGLCKDGFGVSLDEFFDVKNKIDSLNGIMDRAEEVQAELAKIKTEKAKLTQSVKAYLPYVGMTQPFSGFKSTMHTLCYLGIVSEDKLSSFVNAIDEIEFCYALKPNGANDGVICVVAHKDKKRDVEECLLTYGFSRCGFNGDKTATEIIGDLEKGENDLDKQREELCKEVAGFVESSLNLKLYADYLRFIKEKEIASSGFKSTKNAFVMECWIPTEATDRVKETIEKTCSAHFLEIRNIPRNEFAPTLMKNKKVIADFEPVTNMYSPPAYGALDPNSAMSFFFTLFMGIIMADVGYGILMLVGGLLFASKQRDGTSIKGFAKVFAYGGVFAIFFGALFDSWFGFDMLRQLLGEGYNAFYANYLDAITAPATVAGIGVPAILLWCLGLGTLQIAFSLVLKALICFERGKILEGVCSGLLWAMALVAFVVGVFGMASNIGKLATYGMYIAGGSAVLGMLTSGITEKGIGKITKIFSSAYGVVNYVSDILSYARLYGLMLSGAQIAAIFTKTLAIGMLFPLGPFGVIMGILLIIVGNVFNLAMSLLGAFIHDSRLQYVEFFGRFYEGEGELFTPLGSSAQHSYIKVIRQ